MGGEGSSWPGIRGEDGRGYPTTCSFRSQDTGWAVGTWVSLGLPVSHRGERVRPSVSKPVGLPQVRCPGGGLPWVERVIERREYRQGDSLDPPLGLSSLLSLAPLP